MTILNMNIGQWSKNKNNILLVWKADVELKLESLFPDKINAILSQISQFFEQEIKMK